jgi:hypothetical protein
MGCRDFVYDLQKGWILKCFLGGSGCEHGLATAPNKPLFAVKGLRLILNLL